MQNKQPMRKPVVLSTILILLLAICVPACTRDGVPTSSSGISGKPYTPPKDYYPTSKTPSGVPVEQTPVQRTRFEPVALPPDMTGRITEMLKVIPNSSEVFQGKVWFIDYEAWDEILGINRDDYRDSEGNATIESENNYINDLVLSSFDFNDTTRIHWYPWLGYTPYISGMGARLNYYIEPGNLKKNANT